MFFRKRQKQTDPETVVSEPIKSLIDALETRPDTFTKSVLDESTDQKVFLITDKYTGLEIELFGSYIGVCAPDDFCLTRSERSSLTKAIRAWNLEEKEKRDEKAREKWTKLYNVTRY